MLRELEKTKMFLADRNCLIYRQYEEKVLDRTMIKWITFGWVSPIYSLLSPWMAKVLNEPIEKAFSFDFSIYKSSINDEVVNRFKEIFDYEQ